MSAAVSQQQLEQLADKLIRSSHKLVSAESCSGGQLAAMLTDIPGSSRWFERGFVTYSNKSKMELLNVKSTILQQYGAVSEETVAAMVFGAVKNSHARLGVAVTGIAGPDGGSDEKPVGTVCLGWHGIHGNIKTTRVLFKGDRYSIRSQSCVLALRGLLEILGI